MKVEIGPRWGRIAKEWKAVDLVDRPGVTHVADWSECLPFPEINLAMTAVKR